MTPLVSVICVSYNHGPFVWEALESVTHQTYVPIELILVDDASTDNTVEVIRDWLNRHAEVKFLAMNQNGGNCRAFNSGLREAKGKYIIDLSADDVLLPERVKRGVTFLEEHPDTGVQFSDAERIDEQGRHLGFHSDRFPHDSIPQGKIFRDVLARYFINSPTMMIRKSLLDELGGYDESLAYEDFDFWIRSTPRTDYAYLPEVLIRRREVKSSMGKKQYRTNSRQAASTLRVCKKAMGLCVVDEDFRALRVRAAYELRQALRAGNLPLAWSWLMLWLSAR